MQCQEKTGVGFYQCEISSFFSLSREIFKKRFLSRCGGIKIVLGLQQPGGGGAFTFTRIPSVKSIRIDRCINVTVKHNRSYQFGLITLERCINVTVINSD